MRPSPTAKLCATLVAALALAGCGGSRSGAASSDSIPLKSAEIRPGHPIPARYTCDGKNIPPTLEWGAVPRGTGQLVLLVVGLIPSSPSSNQFSTSIEWAVAGISPRLHTLTAGRLPRGTEVGFASDGKTRYSICPKKGVNEYYQFTLYAVPAGLAISKDFEGISALAVLSKPHTRTSALAQGAFITAYKRR
jgi:phosphatidylethanolamine-binding protein (PEBP) family uncharacterized protein